MLFDSSLRKELGRSFGATLVVVLTIVMTVLLVQTLERAAVGRVNPSEVLLVMGFTVLGYLASVITLSLFIAITSTLSRMYSSSEMVVWFSCGRGLFSFLPSLLRFAAPILLVVTLLSLLVWPWSNLQIRELRDRYQGRQDVERVAPGRFVESAGGQRVFFVEKDADSDTSASNIFVSVVDQGREAVVSARSGHVDIQGTERFLVLEDGFRFETDIESGDMRLSEFDEYSARIEVEAPVHTNTKVPELRSTGDLLANPSARNHAELSWRLGLLLAAFNCILLALAATRVNVRSGRSSSLLFALFTFTIYYNLINFGQNWIQRGRVGLVPWMLMLHGGIMLGALLWMAWRERSWRRPRAPAGADTP